MYQKSTHNNRRSKEPSFPTPFTRIDDRNTYLDDNQLCLEHSSPLELICLHCDHKPLCSHCVQLPAHQSHDIKSIEWMKSSIHTQYNEWILKLEHKTDRLENLHLQYENNKAEVNSFSKAYQEHLAREFEEIVEILMERLHTLSSQIEAFIREYIFEMSSSMERMRAKMKDMQKIITQYDKETIPILPLPELARYSFEIREKVSELLDESDINAYKERSIKPEWSINHEALRQIRNNVSAITINFKDPQRLTPSQDKSRKKGRKDLTLNECVYREKSEHKLKNSIAASPFLSTLTPKNKSREKKLKQKRSPQVQLLKKRKKSSAKMISMPASPAKEVESTFLITPELSRKKLFKKK